jgi:Flp pilus assembly protein TadG
VLRARVGEDRGALAPAVAVMLVALFILTGLVVDGSRYLDARSTAQAYAEEAARAGAMEVDLSQPALTLLSDNDVRQKIDDYCTQIERDSSRSSTTNAVVTKCGGAPDLVTNSAAGHPIVVHAQVTVRITTWMLDIIGVNTFTATVDASAEPQEGVLTPNDD